MAKIVGGMARLAPSEPSSQALRIKATNVSSEKLRLLGADMALVVVGPVLVIGVAAALVDCMKANPTPSAVFRLGGGGRGGRRPGGLHRERLGGRAALRGGSPPVGGAHGSAC
jgi:hypothetical protein